ncbi:MAG: hypothetical protein JWM91_3766 [Rhodospirillales bacterium]|nr:hypothetical protein [Rhodospirillales bacterium]
MSSVIIVDDQSTNRKVMSMLVSTLESDVQVIAFDDPLKALSYAHDHTPDLLITDFLMPTINGAEFIRRFRNVHHCADVPAIVVSADGDPTYRALALEAGADDFIASPVDHGEFLSRFAKLLAIRQSRRMTALSPSLKIAPESKPAEDETKEFGRDQIDIFNALVRNISERLVLKIQELKRVGAELQTLLTLGGTSAIFLDENMFIRRFTPQTQPIYALGAYDIGRPLDSVVCKLNYDTLASDFQTVMRTGKSFERYIEHRSGAEYYLMRIVPNRCCDDFLGATIIFTNVHVQEYLRAGRLSVH